MASEGLAIAPPDLPATYGRLSRIAGPTDFFKIGAGYRAALLVKIHGCVDRYRTMVNDPVTWSNYLPSMVFTYREIQNWRKDSWSRDLVSTLLRTRTIVLCGYSGADPVIHDTFRTAYEEMRPQSPNRDATEPGAARAFFTGNANSCEFHGLEILRAASLAAGTSEPQLTNHPNYLPFHYADDHARRFPDLDEVMLWIYHRTFRTIQKKALQTDLRRVAAILLKHRVPEAELDTVRGYFDQLQKEEQALSSEWSDSADSRWPFYRVVGWTNYFHTALLREFALAEATLGSAGPGLYLSQLRSARYYCSALDQPGWAAWAAVIEIATRRMIAVWRGRPETWSSDLAGIAAADCEYPAVLFSKGDGAPTPACLMFRTNSSAMPGERLRIKGVYRYIHSWNLSTGLGGEVPIESHSPSANALWRSLFQRTHPDTLSNWLGE